MIPSVTRYECDPLSLMSIGAVPEDLRDDLESTSVAEPTKERPRSSCPDGSIPRRGICRPTRSDSWTTGVRDSLAVVALAVALVHGAVSAQVRPGTADGVAAVLGGDYQRAADILGPIADRFPLHDDFTAQYFMAQLSPGFLETRQLIRATVRINGAQFVRDDGSRVKQATPVTLTALVGWLAG